MIKLFLKYVLHCIAFWGILILTGGFAFKYMDFLSGYFKGNWNSIWVVFALSCITLWSAISVILESKRNG